MSLYLIWPRSFGRRLDADADCVHVNLCFSERFQRVRCLIIGTGVFSSCIVVCFERIWVAFRTRARAQYFKPCQDSVAVLRTDGHGVAHVGWRIIKRWWLQSCLCQYRTSWISRRGRSEGSTRKPGNAGPPGLPRPREQPGPQGIMGPPGAKGFQDLPDVPGFKGDQGPKGEQGTPGMQSPEGMQGKFGKRGPTAELGPQGQAGSNGRTGSTGPGGFPGILQSRAKRNGVQTRLGRICRSERPNRWCWKARGSWASWTSWRTWASRRIER